MALGERQPDWQGWVSVTETFNYCNGNPLVDWLNLYGTAAGFVADSRRPGYDKRFDYVSFMLTQSWSFRKEYLRWLSTHYVVRTIAGNASQTRDPAKVEETLAAINERVAIIAHPILWNRDDRMAGMPTLLIRSDVLAELIGSHPGPEGSYCVVVVKFVTFDLLKDGTTSLKHQPHMVESWIYNEMLGKAQGHTPDASYLLGRDGFAGLAPVSHDDPELRRLATEGAAWVRRLKEQGASWHVLPSPSVPELRPNLKAYRDQEWRAAKQEVALALRDLTLLPYVGFDRRARAAAAGVTRWDDPTLSSRTFGLGENSVGGRRIDCILAANRSTSDQGVFPLLLTSDTGHWREPARVERFISLQSVDDQADDFSSLPDRGGTAMTFMISWGLVGRDGQWQTGQLVAHDLTLPAEAELKRAWLEQVERWASAEGVRAQDIRLIHWGNAEVPFPELNWLDLLDTLIHAEPVAVRGAFGFGLAEMARALHALGLIETALPDRPVGTLETMAGAWSAAKEAAERQVPLEQTAPMQMIARFSQDLCASMMESLVVLRKRAAWAWAA